MLDAGAGDGWFAHRLLASLPSAQLTCWDAYYTEPLLAELTAQASPQVCFVRERPEQRFDLIMLLDVLEHVEEDSAFLSALVNGNLSAEGAVLVSVPAWQALFTEHDTRLRHYRRYAPGQAARVIEQCGLRIDRRGGLFHGLLLPRAAEKARELLRPPASHGEPPSLAWNGSPFVTEVIQGLLAADGALSRASSRIGLELPGLSWWALCRRR